MGQKSDFFALPNSLLDDFVDHAVDIFNTDLLKCEVPVLLGLDRVLLTKFCVAKCRSAASRAANPHVVALCGELKRQS